MEVTEERIDDLHREANDLYWNSADTVEEVAARLGMSRNALYASVRPMSAPGACTTCGDSLLFTNRSSRTSGQATCSGCSATVRIPSDAAAGTEGDGLPKRSGWTNDADGMDQISHGRSGRLGVWRDDLAAVPPERTVKIGGFAALGVAFGVAAVTAARKMT